MIPSPMLSCEEEGYRFGVFHGDLACRFAPASEEILIPVAADRDKVLQAAQKLVEKKRYDKAIAEYQKLVVEDPKDVRTLLKIGDLYLKMEQYADAITTYERVGQHYSITGFHLKAIAVYKQIREIIHKHVPHLEDRFGHIVPKLAETYRELKLNSDAVAAYEELAARYQRAGRDRDLIDVFRKILDLDPQNPLPYLRLAEAHIRIKEVDEAISRFGAAAEILIKLSRRDDALKVLERLLQYRAEARFARVAAEIYLERRESTDAMAALAKLQICFKENPKDLETLALLARAFDQLGQPAKSIEVQKEAAHIAKDAGKADQFNALLDALMARAPNDEGVRRLATLRVVPPSLRMPLTTIEPPSLSSPVSLRSEVSIDVVLDEDTRNSFSVSAPFALRPARAPTQIAPAREVDLALRVRQVIVRVDACRQAKDYDQATAVLFEAIEALPAVRELREKLCDVLIEVGESTEAVRQMLTFARWLSTNQDVDGAARILDEVLLLDAGQPEALAMLRELGYAMVEARQPADEASTPLPAYEIEKSGADVAPRSNFQEQLDDPFSVGEAPRPSVSTESPRGAANSTLDEEALEEVDFFVSQGMFDEGRTLLVEQLQRLPQHPLLLERLRELEEQQVAAQGGDSGTRRMPRSVAPASSNSASGEDRAFDIAATLDALDALDAGPPQAFDPDQVSVESVFQQFKAGVAAQISESDASTHYDLGVAYKEMGLFSDAIQEFELASREANRECVCQSMIGMIYRELGNTDAAIDAFIRGLQAQVKTRDQELALTYEIGDCYEARHAYDQALYYFQRVTRMSPSYHEPRGAAVERVRRLEPSPRPAPAMAVGAELTDEFDAVLDNLLGGHDPS